MQQDDWQKENQKSLDRIRGLRYYRVVAVAAYDAGWSSSVARRAHNPKVGGSSPSPATILAT